MAELKHQTVEEWNNIKSGYQVLVTFADGDDRIAFVLETESYCVPNSPMTTEYLHLDIKPFGRHTLVKHYGMPIDEWKCYTMTGEPMVRITHIATPVTDWVAIWVYSAIAAATIWCTTWLWDRLWP